MRHENAIDNSKELNELADIFERGVLSEVLEITFDVLNLLNECRFDKNKFIHKEEIINNILELNEDELKLYLMNYDINELIDNKSLLSHLIYTHYKMNYIGRNDLIDKIKLLFDYGYKSNENELKKILIWLVKYYSYNKNNNLENIFNYIEEITGNLLKDLHFENDIDINYLDIELGSYYFHPIICSIHNFEMFNYLVNKKISLSENEYKWINRYYYKKLLNVRMHNDYYRIILRMKNNVLFKQLKKRNYNSNLYYRKCKYIN